MRSTPARTRMIDSDRQRQSTWTLVRPEQGLFRSSPPFSDPRRLYTDMLTFMEYIAQSRKMALPDTHTMLAMAGVSLESPDEEKTKRLMNWHKKRPIPSRTDGTRKPARPSPGGVLKPPVI